MMMVMELADVDDDVAATAAADDASSAVSTVLMNTMFLFDMLMTMPVMIQT